jgi:thiamine-phosphate pyrophosphorylase
MRFSFPKVYPILDAAVIPPTGRDAYLRRIGEALTDAGVVLLEYRNKSGSENELKSDARSLRAAMPSQNIKLILDDRVDLVDELDFDGAHADAGDLSPMEARSLLGSTRIIGTFGGSDNLLTGILEEPADYFAIGPVFPTTTKQTAKTPIGVEGVRRLRKEAGTEPVLVAAAGITLATASAVLAAGANSVAVSAAIFRTADPAAEFRRWMKELN